MYAHLIQGANEDERKKFDHELNAPLAGWAAVERRIAELVREAD